MVYSPGNTPTMDYIAIPWITDYLEELRSIVQDCHNPMVMGELCIQCREKERFIRGMEEILKEHGR